MRQTLVIARREMAERKFVLVGALAFAVLPFLIAALPGHHAPARDVIAMGSAILSSAFTIGLAGILGASFIGRELSDGRISFYFSRPVSAQEIWFGKLLAALALVLFSFAIIIGPAAALGRGSAWFRPWMDVTGLSEVVLVVALALFLLSHTIGTFVRSHSPWIAVDFCAAVGFGWVCWSLALPLLLAGAEELLMWLGIAVAIAVALAVVAGGAWQLAKGRTDRRRNHLELSRFLWAALVGVLIVTGGFVAWVVSATPSDLLQPVNGYQSPASDWAVIAGKIRHRGDYGAAFVYNTNDGAYHQLEPGNTHGIFSPDGTKLIQLRRRGLRSTESDLVILDLPSARSTDPQVTFSHPWLQLAMSGDNRRLAVVDSGLLTIYELAERRSLGSARVPSERTSMFFLSPDRLRLIVGSWRATPAAEPRKLELYEYDVPARRLTRTGVVTAFARWMTFTSNADGSRLIVRTGAKTGMLVDGRTGALIATVDMPARFLYDGRIVVTGDRSVAVLTPDGALQREIATVLERGDRWGVKEVALGILAFIGKSGVTLVDCNRGTAARRGGASMSPATSEWYAEAADPRRRPPKPVILARSDASLVRWNLLTGETKVLISGP